MAYERDVLTSLVEWLEKEIQQTSDTITDGSCKSFDEYKQRCGRLRALTDTVEEIDASIKHINNPEASNEPSIGRNTAA